VELSVTNGTAQWRVQLEGSEPSELPPFAEQVEYYGQNLLATGVSLVCLRCSRASEGPIQLLLLLADADKKRALFEPHQLPDYNSDDFAGCRAVIAALPELKAMHSSPGDRRSLMS
jgi:hypothetical protein